LAEVNNACAHAYENNSTRETGYLSKSRALSGTIGKHEDTNLVILKRAVTYMNHWGAENARQAGKRKTGKRGTKLHGWKT